MGMKVAVDLHRIPPLAVSHIVNGNIVLLGPEKRNCIESFLAAKDVFCRYLPLLLSHHKVLNSNHLPRMRIGPPCNVARGKDS